jgi:hypothetical protein
MTIDTDSTHSSINDFNIKKVKEYLQNIMIKRIKYIKSYERIKNYFNEYNIVLTLEQLNILNSMISKLNNEINNLINDNYEELLITQLYLDYELQNGIEQNKAKIFYNRIFLPSYDRCDYLLDNNSCVVCLDLVEKKYKCGCCKSNYARYCSKKCQKKDWINHKYFCNDLQINKT